MPRRARRALLRHLYRAAPLTLGLLAPLALAGVHCSSGDDAASGDAGGDADATAVDGSAPRDAADDSEPGDAGACVAPTTTTAVVDSDAGLATVANDPGPDEIADLSIFYPPGAPGGALAYSSVPLVKGVPNQAGLRSRVALSADQGATWTYVAEVNTPTATTPPAALCPDAGACTDMIVNETPSIVFDATDAEERQWKLFTHRYQVVTVAGDPEPKLLYTVGHIAMFTAKLPSGPWSAAEVAVGWPGTPFSADGAAYLATSDAHTASCGAFGEPGATLAPDGSLHLALGCIQPPFADPTIDIVLLRSVDHGATWSYVSTPLHGSDGACYGGAGKRVNAVDLFTLGASEYLMATPEGPNARAGCVIFPFQDVASGTLARTSGGSLAATRHLDPQFASSELAHYAGACTYGEGAPKTGYTMSHLVLEASQLPRLRELRTGLVAP